MTSTERTTSRVAVVTGGASGMGEATCRRLASAGHRVGVLDKNGEGAQRVAERLQADGCDALGLAVDVTDRPGLDDAFAKVRSELGPTEILVTSAGMSAFDDFADITPERWRAIVEVNLTGTFHACQAALVDMVAGSWGRIVTISSSSAQRGSPRCAHYAAAKAGVMVLTKSLARAYAPLGITVNCIPPSGIDTPMQHEFQASGELPSNEVMAATIPLGYLGTPDDVAAAVVFLVSEDARYITGQILGVNGGAVL